MNFERRLYQKLANSIYFNFHRLKGDQLLLILNEEIKLPDVIYIHQLQNLYYDLTGDLLLIPGTEPPIKEIQNAYEPVKKMSSKHGPGKYRNR